MCVQGRVVFDSVCVCVKLCIKEQGDWSRFAYPVQRSYGISVEEWSDQPLVPAQLLLLNLPVFYQRSGCLGVQVFHERSKTYLLQTQRFSVALHDWFSWLQSHRCLHLSYKCVFAGRFPSATRWHGSRCDPCESAQQVWRRQMCTSSTLLFLPFFLLCFLASRCGHVYTSFRLSDFKMTGNVFIRPNCTWLVSTAHGSPASKWISQAR